jgi:hypothetical protein
MTSNSVRVTFHKRWAFAGTSSLNSLPGGLVHLKDGIAIYLLREEMFGRNVVKNYIAVVA